MGIQIAAHQEAERIAQIQVETWGDGSQIKEIRSPFRSDLQSPFHLPSVGYRGEFVASSSAD